MKHNLLDYLVCPDCQAALVCHIIQECEGEIETGRLACPDCKQQYPIVRGIPRFVTGERPLTTQNSKTAAAFGWEWQTFPELHDLTTYKAQFLDWIAPIQPAFFQDKVVLDAGCGMGRFSLVSSHLGASQVLAVDASAAVEAARQNARPFPNVHIIQGDIHKLPLRQGNKSQIDFIFSIGVLHHLDDPQAGFKALVRHMQPDGSIFAWVYGRENNGWLLNIVNPIRTRLTSRLPRWILYGISGLLTLGLHPLVRLVYRPVNTCDSLSWIHSQLPYNDYLNWLGQFSFRHNHHVVFDHLVAPVAFYLRRETFTAWFPAAGLEIIDISWRNRNSWRGHGRFPIA